MMVGLDTHMEIHFADMGKEISPLLCVRCKGYRKLCGLPKCPLMIRFSSRFRSYVKIRGSSVSGATPPSGLVGESGYPEVPVLVGIPPGVGVDNAATYDSPESWWGTKSLEEIIELRSSMVSALLRVNARNYKDLYRVEIPFAMVSSRPVDAEAKIKSLSSPAIPLDPRMPPQGLIAVAESVHIGSNPKVPGEIEKIYSDELKASEAIWRLYKQGVSIYTIQRALSFGLLGIPKNRRIVPTRWAITAVDTTIAMKIHREIRSMNSVDSVELYRCEYLGNRFWVILYPGPYSYEWIEIWHPNTIFTGIARKPIIIRNREGVSGEAVYMDGGYQAARLAVLESLYRRGRRASIIVIREITPRYYASVGNWHIRETVRRSLMKSPEKPESLLEAISIVKEELMVKDLIRVDRYSGTQTTLDRFFSK